MISLGREEIESSSAVTVDRMIKEIPQNFDLGVSENSRGQSGGSGNITYGNSVNIRGIGPYATLVIIDGHRVASNSRSIDPSVLPSLGVERIEVVADGASAIYGSDAVAGVVNLIPRRSLDGVEAFVRGGISDDGDFTEMVARRSRYGNAVRARPDHDRRRACRTLEPVAATTARSSSATRRRSAAPTGAPRAAARARSAPAATTYAIPQGGVTQATAGSAGRRHAQPVRAAARART